MLLSPNYVLNSPWGSPFASQFAGLDPTVRGGDFGTQWKLTALTDSTSFFDAQRQFMQATHYDPVVTNVLNATGLDINAQPDAVREAVFSIATQHSQRGADYIITQAVNGLSGTINPSDAGYSEALVNQMYDERIDYALPRIDPKGLVGVINRYNAERATALQILGH